MGRIVFLLTLFLFVTNPAHAEWSVALKEGFVGYDKHGSTEFDGHGTYDNEWTKGGVYTRYKHNSGWFARLGYDTVKTGNTFHNDFPVAYEGISLRTHSILFHTGYFPFSWLYLGAGLGAGFNDWRIVEFHIHPITLKTSPTFITSLIAGLEMPLGDHFFLFSEVRHDFEKQKVKFRGDVTGGGQFLDGSITEDISNTAIYGGVGWRF